jgi:integrase
MTGHIRRRGSRSRELKFDLGTDPLTGKRLTRYHSFKGTKREAQAELTRLTAGADAGNYVDPSKLTVAEYLDRWERDWAAVNVSPRTRAGYGEILRLRVRPRLGGTRLQNLRPVNLAELYAKLLREGRYGGGGLSPRTVGHAHRVMHKALVVAVEWGLMQSNPADVAKPPPVDSPEIEILDGEQVKAVLQRMDGRSIYPIVAVALGTGMRRSEILALVWDDVDLDKGKIRVEHSVEQTKAGLRMKGPKTKHGRRTISLPASVVSILRAYKVAQQELRLRLGAGKMSGGTLVFANDEGQLRRPDAVSLTWRRAVSALGLPKVSFHALRHTHASQLIASGMDVLTISRRLGHGSPTITLGVYGHLFANTDDRAAQIIEAAFPRATTE